MKERMLHDGTVHLPLEEEEVKNVLETIESAGIATIVAYLLHSYANPLSEELIGELTREGIDPNRISVVPSLEMG